MAFSGVVMKADIFCRLYVELHDVEAEKIVTLIVTDATRGPQILHYFRITGVSEYFLRPVF
jgi:hypothetical protein